MGDVVNLNAKAITPKQVLEKCLEHEDVTHAYVVLVHESGHFTVHASGDLSRLPGAALQMQYYATRVVRKEVESE